MIRLKTGYLTHDTGKEIVLVGTAATGFRGMVRGNSTLAFILDFLKKGTDQGSIVKAMVERFGITEETALLDVNKVLAALREVGAIEEDGNI